MSRRERAKSSGSVAIWVLVAVVAVGVLMGGSAFYYFAVYIPWQKEVVRLQNQEVDTIVELEALLDTNKIAVAIDRELYQSFVDRLKDTHYHLRMLGVEPRYPIPPFREPRKKPT